MVYSFPLAAKFIALLIPLAFVNTEESLAGGTLHTMEGWDGDKDDRRVKLPARSRDLCSQGPGQAASCSAQGPLPYRKGRTVNHKRPRPPFFQVCSKGCHHSTLLYLLSLSVPIPKSICIYQIASLF
jgi:hypothetical protein